MTATTSSLVDDLNRSVRENPAAAGLIGLGVVWMLFGRSNLAAISSFGSRTVTSVARAGSSAAGSAAKVVADGVHSAATGLSDAATALKDDAVNAREEPGANSANSSPQDSRHSQSPGFGEVGHSVATSLQRNLSEALDRQPILLGAIGLALGAGIAAAIPATEMERRMIGEKGAAMKNAIREMASDTADEATLRFEHASQRVKEEAATQVTALKDQFSTTAEKLAAVAGLAKETTKRRSK